MPSKKAKKKDPKLLKKPKRLPAWFWIIVIPVLIFGGIKIVQQVALEQKFKSLEKDLVSLQTELRDQNPPIQTELKRECYRERFKFEEGPLNCSVGLDSVEAVNQEGVKTINHKLLVHGYKKTTGVDLMTDYEKKGVSCRLNFDHADNNDLRLNYEFHCIAFSQRAFYPTTLH